MEDQLIRVDIYDKEVGYGTKEEVHRKGLLHRAFSVFLVDDDRMLIQKRHREKYHSGGLWANSCCSHPRKDESLEEAVERRLEEELGVQAPCRELCHFVYYMKFSEDMHEYELDHVFVGSYDGEVQFDDTEIEPGMIYYYKVRAFVKKGDKKLYGQFSPIESNGYSSRIKSKY